MKTEKFLILFQTYISAWLSYIRSKKQSNKQTNDRNKDTNGANTNSDNINTREGWLSSSVLSLDGHVTVIVVMLVKDL